MCACLQKFIHICGPLTLHKRIILQVRHPCFKPIHKDPKKMLCPKVCWRGWRKNCPESLSVVLYTILADEHLISFWIQFGISEWLKVDSPANLTDSSSHFKLTWVNDEFALRVHLLSNKLWFYLFNSAIASLAGWRSPTRTVFLRLW